MKEINVQREGSYINVTIKTDKEKIGFFCKDIRGALVWPTVDSPGYYAIFCQKVDVNPQGKSPLLLLSEGQEELPKDLFQRLVKDAKRLACGQFYTDFKKEDEGVRTLFGEFCRYQRVFGIQLTRSPLLESPHLCILILKEWLRDKAIEIPKETTLHSQLGKISAEDLKELKGEFFAVEALRLLVGSLEGGLWQANEFDEFIDIDSARRRHRDRKDPRGWT